MIVRSKNLESLGRRDCDNVFHPMTELKRHQKEGALVVERGEGVFVFDDQGSRYLEGVSGLWSIALGFGEKRLADAAYAQMQKLPSYHMFRYKTHPQAIELAEKLIELMPIPMSKVFFANSGSEANDTAVKLVWYYHNEIGKPEKKKIIGRIGGYHGVTIAAASLTGLGRLHEYFDLPLDRFIHTDNPHYWRNGLDGESEEAFATRCAENLEKLILKEGPETIGAFIAEPISGSGGVILPPKTYFEKIQPILKKYEILFIVDEVITGFGRLGDIFGSVTYDLVPDMVTLAKGLSSGYAPISALMVNEKIFSRCVEQSSRAGVFSHGFTYSGHPLSCAVANEALRIYEDIDIVSRVREAGPILAEGLSKFRDHPLVGEVRGTGLVYGIEIVKNKATKASFPAEIDVGLYLERRCQERGVILRALGDTLTISPPLIISKEEIGQIVDCVEASLADTLQYLSDNNLLD